MAEQEKRMMDGVMMNRIDGLETKMDNVVEVVHKIDKCLTEFTTKFNGQVILCDGKFTSIVQKSVANCELSEKNKDAIESFQDQVKGGKTTLSVLTKWIPLSILVLLGFIGAYLKGKGAL